jgi:peptide/nickel transport system permease protein
MRSKIARRLAREPLFWAGAVLLSVVLAAAAGADLLTRHPPDRSSGEHVRPPSAEHPLGTDVYGFDVWSRLAHGARTSLLTGTAAVALAFAVGVPLGAVAGWRGGFFDSLAMRGIDVLLAFPSVLLAIAVAAVAGGGSVGTLVLAVGTVQVPLFARQTRAAVLQARQEDWVTACRAGGLPPSRTLFRHVLPNCLAPLLVLATLGVGSAILSAAGLAWLGLGPPPETAEWGVMLQDGYHYVRDARQWMVVPPGAAIAATVLGFNLIGDALRAALDPRLR